MLATTYETIDGVRCAVHDAGDVRSTEAVVFVHGNPGPLDDWEEIAPQLAPFVRVIAMDLPGFGRAHRGAGFSYTVEGYAAYLGKLLERLRVRRAHLVLHDFGGAWGARWALEHPDALASLTLIDTPLSADFRWHFWAKVWQTPWVGELLQRTSTELAIRFVLAKNSPRPLPKRFVDRVLAFTDLEQKLAVLDLYRDASDPAQCFGPIAEGLRTLDPPACIIWGAQDPFAKPAEAASLRALFTHAELHLLPGAGHWPMVDEPARVRELVCSFVTRQMKRVAVASGQAASEDA